MSSHKFAQKIKELEEEGNKLLSSTNTPEWQTSSSTRVSSPIRQRVKDGLMWSAPVSRAQSAPLVDPLSSSPGVSTSPTKHWLSPPPVTFSSFNPRPSSRLSQSQSVNNLPTADKLHQDRELRQANLTIEQMKGQIKQTQRLSEEHKKQFRASTEELTRRLQEALIERDRLAAVRVSEASSQDELISKLQVAVHDLTDTTQQQEKTIQETEKEMEVLQFFKCDYENLLDMLRQTLKGSEKKRGRAYFESEPISKQSSTMLIHSLEKCLDEVDTETSLYKQRVVQLEDKIKELEQQSVSIEKSTTKGYEDRLNKLKSDYESKIVAAEDRSANCRKQTECMREQLHIVQDQYKGSELLREEQTRMLEERIQMLKEQLDGERKDSRTKMESLSKALDSTQRDLAISESEKNELIRHYAVIEGKLTDYELDIEKLNIELEQERDEAKKLWEKENDTMNRNIEIETKIAMKDAELARLEALLEKTKDQCSKQINQEVALAEKYQQEKFGEEKSILVRQVDTLTLRNTQLQAELQQAHVEITRLTDDHKHSLDRVSHLQTISDEASEDKQKLQSQLLSKNEELDRVTTERDQYKQMIEDRNKQFNEMSIAYERAALQREDKERQLISAEETIKRMEERLELANGELDRYQQETAELHQTRTEFDRRIREMEEAVEKQNRKIKSKDKKIADGDSERQMQDEMLTHKSETIRQLEEQVRTAEGECKDIRREIKLLTEERNSLRAALKGQEGEMQREIEHLLGKVKSVEREYKLSKKALKSKEKVDRQATELANKLQEELTDQRKYSDDLRSKIRWLEDCLDSSKKERNSLVEKCHQLESEMDQKFQSDLLSDQRVYTENTKTQELQQKVHSLEAGLKEAITRCASLQTAAEKAEQDLYTVKLKHQLEIKELQRSGERITPTNHLAPSAADYQSDGLATELKTVLNDMKNLLISAQSRRTTPRDRSVSNYLDLTQSDATEYKKESTRSRSHSYKKSPTSIDSLLEPHHKKSSRHHSKSKRHDRKVSEPLKTEAQVLCKNLEKKLTQLSKLSDQSSESSCFASKKKTTPTSYEKLHRYMRTQSKT